MSETDGKVQQQALRYMEKLDAEQRMAVRAEKNCVVTAGAGAGKTTTLASRYIYLVMEKHIPVRRILALTFTRKAAAEMYGRIYGELASMTSPWALEQLSDFPNAQIMTIDSFCASVVRQGTRELGYTPDFTIDDDQSARMINALAEKYVVANAQKPGLSDLLKAHPMSSVISDLFCEIARNHVTPKALFSKPFAPMKAPIRGLLARTAAGIFADMQDMARAIIEASALIPSPRQDCLEAISCAMELRSAAGLADQDSPQKDGQFPFEALDELFERLAGLGFRSYAKNDSEISIKGKAKKIKQHALDLQGLHDFQNFLPVYDSILDRLDEFARECAEAKRMADLMDYKDLGRCAVDILKERKDLRRHWKQSIDSILIDEFQDNNDLQKDLLYLLAEKTDAESEGIPGPESLDDGKLFFVGDEKQSIYRFRGADVSVFKRLSGELAQTGKNQAAYVNLEADSRNFTLSTNYRSSSKLIDFFNSFFAFAMDGPGRLGEGDDRLQEAGIADFYARYLPMKPGGSEAADLPATEAAGAAGRSSRVAYFLLDPGTADADDDEDSDTNDSPDEAIDLSFPDDSGLLEPDDSLALEIAQFIKDSADKLQLRPDGRKANYGDFAILLRSSANQHKLEKYLRLLDIPFETESQRSLFKESAANDLYNILLLFLNPCDRVAYATVLRSPLCRISDEGFMTLMADKNSALFESSLETELSEYDKRMLERARQFYRALEEKARSCSVSQIALFVWHFAGLRIDIASKSESRFYLEHFDYLFEIATTTDEQHGGIGDFLDRLRPYITGSIDKFESAAVPQRRQAGVHIMTIHKAKGLEFPIVIIPWVENAGSKARSQKLWQMLPEGLTIDIKPYDKPGAAASNIFFRLTSSSESLKDEAEIQRLLYVACTRAEDYLFFFGKMPKRGIAARSFQSYIEGYIDVAGPSAIEKIVMKPRKAEEVQKFHKAAPRIAMGDFVAAYRKASVAMIPAERSRATASFINSLAIGDAASEPGALAEPVSSASPAEFAALVSLAAPAAAGEAIPPERFGILCHDTVEWAINHGSTDDYSPGRGVAEGIEPTQLSAAIDAAKLLASNFISSDFWQEAMAADNPPFVSTEKSFLLRMGDLIIEGRMDLFLETRDSITIIDFKTDMAPGPDRYRTQLELYRHASRGFSGGKNTKIGIFWLRTSTMEWMEGEMSEGKLSALCAMAGLPGQGSEASGP
ncbi:MAG: UvrD-helicase domain-containing protein [Spirochaetaceae bacterium]|nr:UvrD-helicase domain-containing protein [Spirochaetaceae bacterium]